jgi:hypothetical protein
MKTWSGGKTSLSFSSVLDLGQWSASLPSRFASGANNPGTGWVEGWMDPRAGVDSVEKRNYCPCWESNTGRPSWSQSLYPLLNAFMTWQIANIVDKQTKKKGKAVPVIGQ